MNPFNFTTDRDVTKSWYPPYLNDEYWKEPSYRLKCRENWKCAICGASADTSLQRKIVVHHLTYFRVGKEYLIDLIVLCHSEIGEMACHNKFHKIFNCTDILQQRDPRGIIWWLNNNKMIIPRSTDMFTHAIKIADTIKLNNGIWQLKCEDDPDSMDMRKAMGLNLPDRYPLFYTPDHNI